jgi:hypothetical protein
MFGDEGFADFDLFLDFLFFIFLVFLVVLLVLVFINFIHIDGLFHKFLDADKFFEVLVTVAEKVRDVRDGDIQKPDHDVVLFLFEKKADVNPEEDYEESEEDSQSKENVGVNMIKFFVERILGKGVIDEVDEVVIHIIEGIGLEPSKGLNHF